MALTTSTTTAKIMSQIIMVLLRAKEVEFLLQILTLCLLQNIWMFAFKDQNKLLHNIMINCICICILVG